MSIFRTHVAGADRRAGAMADVFNWFHQGKDIQFELVPEPTNAYDRNAVKVVATDGAKFFPKKRHVGYLPAGIASEQRGRIHGLHIAEVAFMEADEGLGWRNLKLTIDDGG